MRHHDPTSLHPKSLHDLDMPTTPNRWPLLRILLVRLIQKLDSSKQLDDVGFPIWCHWIHAPHVLEEKVVSYQHLVSLWVHSLGGV